MGLSAASVRRFRQTIQDTLEELFPVILVIEEIEVPAAGPGGRTVSEYVDGGQAETYRFPFRIQKANAPNGWKPEKGASIEWKISATETLPLEIHQTPKHPWEDVWEITAKKRRIEAEA